MDGNLRRREKKRVQTGERAAVELKRRHGEATVDFLAGAACKQNKADLTDAIRQW